MAGLTLKNISKHFGSTCILDDVSIELAEGELLVLLGPSGCGKSTLLRLIAGLETLDRGEIYIGDRRIDGLLPKDRRVSMVFQNYALYPHMTVAKNLGFTLKIAKMPTKEIKVNVERVASMLGLGDRLNSKPSELSGGQRQRVALGRAIIRKPELFLLDEPLSNLDADLRARMRHEIVRLQKDLKVTTIHVTHDQTEALTMADRIALLQDGRLVQIGTPEQLYADPNCLRAAQAIGSPRINVISGTVQDGRLMPFDWQESGDYPVQADGPYLIGLRPEAVVIEPSGQYEGKVSSSEYLGEHYIIRLDYKGIELVSSGSRRTCVAGDNIRFNVSAEAALFFQADSGERINHTV